MTSQTINIDIPDRRPRRWWQRVTSWLIILNVAVFFIDQAAARYWHTYVLCTQRVMIEGQPFQPGDVVIMRGGGLRVAASPDGDPGVLLMPPLEFWGHFSAKTTIGLRQWWRLFTFQFLHASTTHLLLNMLGLYMFGPLVEMYLGARRFLAFYLICGAAGAVGYIALWAAKILVATAWTPLVGASAGIFGILIASARLAPDTRVMLLFPPIPMKLKTLVWVLIGLAAVSIFFTGHNAGGEAAHLGGAIAGIFADHESDRARHFRQRRTNARSEGRWCIFPGGGRAS